MRLYYGADFVDIVVDSTADVLDAAAELIATHTPHIQLDALPIGCKVAARILHGGVNQVGKRLTIGPSIGGGETISPSSYSPSLAPQRTHNTHTQNSITEISANYLNTCQLLLSKAYQKPSQLVTFRSVLEVILLSYDSAKGFEMFLREDLEFIGSVGRKVNDGHEFVPSETTAIRASAAPTSLSSGNAAHFSKNSVFGNRKKGVPDTNSMTSAVPALTNNGIQKPTYMSDFIEDEDARNALISRNNELKRDLDRSKGINIEPPSNNAKNKAARPDSSSTRTPSSRTQNSEVIDNDELPTDSASRKKLPRKPVKYSESASNDIDTRGFVSIICEFNPPVITLVGSVETAITSLLEEQIFDKCVAPTAQAHYYEQNHWAPPGGRYEAYMRRVADEENNSKNTVSGLTTTRLGSAPSPTRQTYDRMSANRPSFQDIHQDRTVRIQRLSLPHHHFNEVQQGALYVVVMDVMEQCAKNGIGMGGEYSSDDEEYENAPGRASFRREPPRPSQASRQPFYYKLVPFDGETSLMHHVVKQAAINNLRAIRGPQGRFTDSDLLSTEPYKHSCELLFIPTLL